MVKLFAVLRRNPGLTVDEFVHHWREVHGPLIASEPTLARHIVRYEQHVRHTAEALSGTEGVDGVAVQWFDSIDDFVAFISEPKYRELIAPDERRLLDLDRLEFVITEEPTVIIDGQVGTERSAGTDRSVDADRSVGTGGQVGTDGRVGTEGHS